MAEQERAKDPLNRMPKWTIRNGLIARRMGWKMDEGRERLEKRGSKGEVREDEIYGRREG